MSHFSEREEVQTEAGEEEFSQLTFPCMIDDEDFKGCSLDNAVKDRMNPPKVDWPNDIYRGFMEIVTEYRLSNACGDNIIKWFNQSTNFQESPLPAGTKQGRKFLDNISYISLSKKYRLPLFKRHNIHYIIDQLFKVSRLYF